MSSTHYTYNKADESKANLLINGEISEWWGTGLREVATEIASSGAKELMVQVNSPGGSVTEGFAISSFLKGYPANINTSIVGLSASIATVISLAGDNTSISEGSFFMVHNPWSFTAGESDELRETANLLDKMKGELVDVYVAAIKKNGKMIDGDEEKTKEQVVTWMNEETWFNAQEAVDAGFIKEVSEGAEFLTEENAKNIYNSCSKFKNVPTDFLNKVKSFVDMANSNETKKEINETKEEVSFFDKVKAWFKTNPEQAKELADDIEKEQQMKKDEVIQNAIDIAKENGFYLAPEEKEVQDNSKALEEEVNSLKATLKALETKLAAPTAGDGPKTTEVSNSINKFAPTAEHKDAVDAFTKIFQ